MRLLPLLLLTCWALTSTAATLAERLGYKATDRIVIINGDDIGMCQAANEASIESMEKGLMTTGTIMVPCPWFPEIAQYAKKEAATKDFGLHLVHTSEWDGFRWGPVAPREKVPGLVDAQGYFHRGVAEVYLRAKPEEALEEARAQIKKALAAGIDVTHLDSHMGTLQVHPAYLDVYAKLGVEFNLPLRMGSQSTFNNFGFPRKREEVRAMGIVFPDYLIHDELKDEGKMGVKNFWMKTLKNLPVGVTELYIHAAKLTPETRAMTGSHQTRHEQYVTFTSDPDIKKLIEEEKIIRIGYRPLRDLQRKERAAAGR